MTTVYLAATARPTFDVVTAESLLRRARSLLRELGADTVGPSGLLMSPDDAAGHRPPADADLVIHVCATFSDASTAVALHGPAEPADDRPVVLWAFREPGRVGERLLLNSLCGANLVGHALVRAGREVRLCYGDPEEPAVRALLARAIEGHLPAASPLPRSIGARSHADVARTALGRLRGRRIGALGDGPTGFTPSEYDAELLDGLLGLEIAPRTLPSLFDDVAAVPVAIREREVGAALEWQPSLSVHDAETLDRFASVTVALRDWQRDERLDALAVRCWPEFPTELGVCPCSSLSRLADEHVPTQCERDVLGGATMLLLDALDGGPTYLVDTVDVDEHDGVVRFWHCGAAATALARQPHDATQSVHANRRIGVAGDFPLRTGRVTITRLTDDPDRPGGLRMLLAGGESVEAPNRFQGNTADVVLDGDPRRFVELLVTGGFPHHTVLSWTERRAELRAVADELGIPVIEFG